ncbi:hypothetical protein M9H77_02528 [Catharanthus roseus]|uniref:Uncharacterized protein n=1 Tax=Catharanthus roseus TaxID=4058 RepID=A0ACC0C8P6_CATRO|nr:hypothetical protein M9H77_02528 [Catharanthus roseus]
MLNHKQKGIEEQRHFFQNFFPSVDLIKMTWEPSSPSVTVLAGFKLQILLLQPDLGGEKQSPQFPATLTHGGQRGRCGKAVVIKETRSVWLSGSVGFQIIKSNQNYILLLMSPKYNLP